MLTADFQTFSSSRAQNFNSIKSSSILLWKNKLKQSAVLPILIIKSNDLNSKRGITHSDHFQNSKIQKQVNKEGYLKEQCIQTIQFQWNYLASILQQQGPFEDFQLLVQKYHRPVLKMKFKVIINDKEKLIISANWNQTIGEVCDKILISFFNTFIYSQQQFNGVLSVENLPVQINKLKINNKMVSSKDYIGRIANQNDLIRVSLIKKAQITNESQKKILKKYEEYNQKKAKEFKEKQREKSASVSINNNKQQNNSSKNHDQTSQNSSFTEINESDDSLDSLSNIKKKQKIENKQSEDEDDEDQHIFYTIKCKFILSFEKVYIDVWDQFNQENIKFSLCQEETLDDLKTAIEEIIGIEQEKIQIASEVYIHEKLYDFDQLNINYELFNKKTSTLQFFQRQVGG